MYFLPSPRQLTSYFRNQTASPYHWLNRPKWPKVGNFSPKLDKFTFLSTVPATLRGYARNECLEFDQRVKFDYIDSPKDNGTRYLMFFEVSCEEIYRSKPFVDFASARRHRGLSIIYIKHNLWHQTKLGRDVQLENTHFVLFTSPGDVMQIKTLKAQPGLG